MIFWPRWLKDQANELGKYPVTVGHLVEVAAAKRGRARFSNGRGSGQAYRLAISGTGIWMAENYVSDGTARLFRVQRIRKWSPGTSGCHPRPLSRLTEG